MPFPQLRIDTNIQLQVLILCVRKSIIYTTMSPSTSCSAAKHRKQQIQPNNIWEKAIDFLFTTYQNATFASHNKFVYLSSFAKGLVFV